MKNNPRPSRQWRRLLAALVVAATAWPAGAVAVFAQDAPVPPAPPAAETAPAAPAAPVPEAAPAAPPVQVAPAAETAPAAPEPPSPPDDEFIRQSGWSSPAVRVGQDFELVAGERVREVVVVFGSATIAGEVDRDVVVVLGSLRIASTAVIHGSVVTPGSTVVVEQGARVNRDFVVPVGAATAPPSFHPGGDYVVIGVPGLSTRGEAIAPWFTRGLLWGRLLVPSLPWLWAVTGVVVLVYLVLGVLFERPVRTCRQVLVDRPLSAFLVGLLVLVLMAPVSFILSVSIIGIPVLPFLVCGLFIATLLGKVGVTRWIGSTVIAETEPGNQAEAVRSFAIGTVIILLAYMVPVLGIFTWAIGSLFGLGAATLAFSSGLRRENPGRRRAAATAAATASSTGAAFSAPQPDVPSSSERADVDSGAVAGAETAADVEPTPNQPPAGPSPTSASTAGLASSGAPKMVSPVELLGMPKAPFLDRLAAFALDVLLVSITYSLLDMDSTRAFFTLLLGYHIIFWGLKATTVGGIICNLRLVRTDGAPLTFTDALIRGFSSIFSIVALGIGCFWILYDDENQAWHDRFAGTYVVKVPRNWPV